jgi:hypothetical protein
MAKAAKPVGTAPVGTATLETMTATSDGVNNERGAPSRRNPAKPGAASTGRPTGSGQISTAQQRVLNAVAALERIGMAPARRINVAFFAGYTENGHFNNLVGSLRSAGLLDYPAGNMVALTAAGRAASDADAHPILSLYDLHTTFLQKLSASEGKLLKVLIEWYPREISRAELAVCTGYTENGHFNNMVGHLKTLGVAHYPRGGYVAATDVLFPEGLK